MSIGETFDTELAGVTIQHVTIENSTVIFGGDSSTPDMLEAESEEVFGRRRLGGRFFQRIARSVAERELGEVLSAGGGFDVDSIIDAVIERLEVRWQDRPLLSLILEFVKSPLFRTLIEAMITPSMGASQ